MSVIEKVCAGVIVAGVLLVFPAFLFTDPLGILFGLYIIFAVPIILIVGLMWFFAQRKKATLMPEPASKRSYPVRIAKIITLIGVIILVLIFATLITFVVRGF